MVSTRGDKILYQRIPQPRPPLRVVLENVWQVQHDKQSSNEQSCAERDLFKIDLRVQGVPQNAVLEDQGRAPKIQDVVHTLRTQYRTESVITDLNKTNSVRSVRNPKRPSKTWERSNFLKWEKFLRKYSARPAPSTGQKDCDTALAEHV